jgi:Rad3-related DNA helicase
VGSSDVAGQRELKFLKGLREGLLAVSAGIKNEEPWVYTGEGGRRDKDGLAVSFKPSRVDKFGDQLWRHGRKWLLMSATVISSQEMLDSLGYGRTKGTEGKAYRYIGMGSSFPLENRPIYPVPVASNSNKNKDVARELIANACVTIARRHEDERILVHSVSYEYTQMLWSTLRRELPGRKVIHYTNAATREGALEAYKAEPAAILIGPSMERGIDLPGDLCRVQIITKCPFPYLGDRQVSTRLHSPGGQVWYNVQTVRSLVQMTGRGVRSETDHAVTYILDAQFRDMVWSKNRSMIPKWWGDSVRWSEGRQLMADLAGATTRSR